MSNFSSPKLKRLLSVARIPPAVNQIELHPYFPQRGLVKFCNDNGVHVTAYGPLGCTPVPVLIGRRGPGPLEDPEVNRRCSITQRKPLTGAQIKRIASAYNRTPAQIILCFMLNRGVSVIPKSNSPERISSNFDCIFDLGTGDLKAIDMVLGQGEAGVRNLETRDYLGFDNFNEDVEEP